MNRMARAMSLAVLVTVVLGQDARAATTVVVVRESSTSSWSKPSPDPTGLTYRADTGKFLVSDSEVEEIPALWRHKDLFVVSPKGRLRVARNLRITPEAEDIAWDDAKHVLYVADDDAHAVFGVRAGADGKLGTSDDVEKRVLATYQFGSLDPEGLDVARGGRILFIADATGRRVYTVRRGSDGVFGTRDDSLESFRTKRLGLRDPEGVAYDPRSRHLFMVSSFDKVIVETTLRGRLVRQIDISGTGIVAPSSIELAPASTDPSKTHVYVTDRGSDNQSNPSENDGRIFEFRFKLA
jgi:DNA-binding beta-propeller fold protein YncE